MNRAPLNIAARNALIPMSELLQEHGWTKEQAYQICSVAVDLRVSNLVGLPNVTVSALLLEDIFVESLKPTSVQPNLASSLAAASLSLKVLSDDAYLVQHILERFVGVSAGVLDRLLRVLLCQLDQRH
jgi:hypothetical protein